MDFSPEQIDDFNRNSFYQTMGITVEAAAAGEARSALRPHPEMCWPFPRQPHGGVLFTQMDTTMAWAVVTRVKAGENCVTINLDIQYTAPARGDRFVCRAWVRHRSGRIVYTRAEVTDDAGQLVAAGQGAFRVVKAPL